MKICRCFIASAIALFVATSCVDNSVRCIVMSDVDSRSWSETVNLYYENDDTLSYRKLSVALRFNSDFKCDTLPLSLRISLPDGCYAKERVDFIVNRPYRATAAHTVVTLPYRGTSLLNMSGCYIFSMTPDAELRGIEAIGIIIEKEE